MECGIALGSNLGDRLAALREAVRRMSVGCGQVVAVSPVYETEPVDCPEGSGAFLNAVVVLESGLGLLELLRELQGIERAMGRPGERGRNAPRTVDLDVLYAGGETWRDAELTVPHPRIGERRFVLEPLAAVRPGLVLPGQERSAAELLAGLESSEGPLRVYCEGDWR